MRGCVGARGCMRACVVVAAAAVVVLQKHQNLHGKRIAANARWLEQIGDEKWKGTDTSTSTSTSTSTRTRSCIGNVLAMPV